MRLFARPILLDHFFCLFYAHFQQLHDTCKAMQNRLVELISQLANDEVTAELLRINDLLNNLFLR